MKNKHLRGELFLVITALIWGSSFVSQKVSMDHLGPFTFGAARMLLGALVLLPMIYFLRGYATGYATTRLWPVGILIGSVLYLGISTQQFGIQYTTAGKSAFITALYIVLVPLLGYVQKQRPSRRQWISAGLGVVGLYLLSVEPHTALNPGDLITVVSAFFWALHIILIGRYAQRLHPIKRSAIQFLVAGVISAISAFIFEQPLQADYIAAAGPILFTGVMVVGVAYTCQVLGQRSVKAATAALILSFEAVIAVIAGAIFLNEALSLRELIGCLIMFGAIILSQRGGTHETTELSD